MQTIIEEMPNEATLEICQQAWSLSQITFVRKQENIVYRCQRLGKTVFLRFTTPFRRSKSLIEAEMEFITYLAEAGIRVPESIPNHRDQMQMTVTQGNQQYEVVVFSQISGTHPSDQQVVSTSYLKSLGALIASMHKATEKYIPTSSRREHWIEERGIRHAFEAIKTSSNQFMKMQLNETLEWMKMLPRTTETYGLIHADLGSLNLFIEPNNSFGVIDFDDSCYHFFTFDLAKAIYSIAIQLKLSDQNFSEQIWVEHLIKGYRTIRPIAEEQIEQIPRFIDFACLRIYFWIEHHENLKTFHKNHIEPARQMKELALKRVLNHSENIIL